MEKQMAEPVWESSCNESWVGRGDRAEEAGECAGLLEELKGNS